MTPTDRRRLAELRELLLDDYSRPTPDELREAARLAKAAMR